MISWKLVGEFLVALPPLLSAFLVVVCIRSSNKNAQFKEAIEGLRGSNASACTTKLPGQFAAKISWNSSRLLSLVASVGCFLVFFCLVVRGFQTESGWKTQHVILLAIFIVLLIILASVACCISTLWRTESVKHHRLAHVPVLDYVKLDEPHLVTCQSKLSSLIQDSATAEGIGFFAYWFGIGAIGAALFGLLMSNGDATKAISNAHKTTNYVLYMLALLFLISLHRVHARNVFAATMISDSQFQTISQAAWNHTAVWFTINLAVVYFVSVLGIVALSFFKGCKTEITLGPAEVLLNMVAIGTPMLAKAFGEIGKKIGG